MGWADSSASCWAAPPSPSPRGLSSLFYASSLGFPKLQSPAGKGVLAEASQGMEAEDQAGSHAATRMASAIGEVMEAEVAGDI